LDLAGKILLNGGGRRGARKDDEIVINTETDSAFMIWIAAVSAAINSLAPGAINPPNGPTSVTGKINQGSSTVELPDD
jgi:hypothetical protein